MTEPEPNLDDVIVPTEHPTPDHHQHGKTPKHVNDDELEHRTEQERVQAGIDDYDPDDVPPATE
jgi:hypothetical protein